MARLAKVQDHMLAPLSAQERDELTRLLSKVLDHHRNTGGDDAAAVTSGPLQGASKL